MWYPGSLLKFQSRRNAAGEIQCRAQMGQSYSEIERIAAQRQAKFQQWKQEEERAAIAQAETDRAIRLASCKRLVTEYEEGVYYQEGTETLAILNWLDKGTTSTLLERLQQFPPTNAREEDYERLKWPLEILRSNIRRHAYYAQEYEENTSGIILRSPGAVPFSLNCFYKTKFGGLRRERPKLTKDPY